jgi:hypothetical protein
MKLCFVSVNGPREPYLLDELRTYPSAIIGVTENVSHSTAEKCQITVVHSFSCNAQIKCFRTHLDLDMF